MQPGTAGDKWQTTEIRNMAARTRDIMVEAEMELVANNSLRMRSGTEPPKEHEAPKGKKRGNANGHTSMSVK